MVKKILKTHDLCQTKKALPEEIVRQKLLKFLIGPLAFPQELICVEKLLSKLSSHLYVPNRRVDIACYTNELSPNKEPKLLLIIECKAFLNLTEALPQIQGYYLHLNCPFFALADDKAIHLYWKENGKTMSIDHLPLYETLVEGAKQLYHKD